MDRHCEVLGASRAQSSTPPPQCERPGVPLLLVLVGACSPSWVAEPLSASAELMLEINSKGWDYR